MRGTSYLYCFPTHKLTGADFTWGSNIILYFILLLLAFHPKAYIVLTRVCMNDYNKFNSRRRTIRIDSEVAKTPTLPLNKEGILQSSSASWSSGFHMYIYTVSIISKCIEGCLYEFVLSGCLRENILLPICLFYQHSNGIIHIHMVEFVPSTLDSDEDLGCTAYET